MKVDLLRLRLPRWPGDGAAVAVQCGYRQSDGNWRDGGMLALDVVGRTFQARRIEACLHPAEVPMAAFALPPLAGRRLRAAVLGAIEPCALQPVEKLVTVFGARGADGMVPAAWIGREALDGWLGLLRRHGIALRELQLPTAFLRSPKEGWTGCDIDRWLVLRTGPHQGFTQWLPEGMDRATVLADAVVHWAEDDAADRWSGEGWNWSLASGESTAGAAGAALAAPIVGWSVVAIAVWLIGLNVYASQLAAQGQALKRQMATRVKTAFPDVPVVVDPLKQARQQKEALAAGAPASVGGDYGGLSRAASNLLAQTPVGQVQELHYKTGELRIQWREGAAPAAATLVALQAQGREQGLAIEGDARALRVTAAEHRKGTP